MTGQGLNGIDHVLFCVADQWRADAVGALGTPGVTTPDIDALAADGVLFANHWCQASPCGPSRSSLLTGTHLPTHGQWTNDDPADHGLATLARILRQADVDPVLIGYTDTPQAADAGGVRALVDPDFELALGFIWQEGFPTWRAELEARGYDLASLDEHPFGLYAPDAEPDADGLAPSRYAAADSDVAFLTDAALSEVERWSDRSLLHLNWLRPHPPMTAPRPYHRLVDPAEVELPNRPLALAEQAARHRFFEMTIPGRSITEYLQQRRRIESVEAADDRHLRAAYYGLVAEVDHHLGRVIEKLRERGLYDSTLIIVTSDHGDSLGDHWIYGRRGPFDGHFQVPCIIRDPRPAADASRGTRVDDFTANVDLLPTIVEAFGLETPATVEGRSLLAHCAGRRPTRWREHVRYDMDWGDQVRPERRAAEGLGPTDCRFNVIRTGDHRYVRFPTLAPLLFDLTEDPDETVNLADDVGRRSLCADFEALLDKP